MKNTIAILGLVFFSSSGYSATVQGTGRAFVKVNETIKLACESASINAKKSLEAKCGLLQGQLNSEIDYTLNPTVFSNNEGECTAFAEASCL